jgi:hypothetical protein
MLHCAMRGVSVYHTGGGGHDFGKLLPLRDLSADEHGGCEDSDSAGRQAARWRRGRFRPRTRST